jgi:hypothetical protein
VKVKYPLHIKGKLPDGIEPYFEMETSADSEFREFVRRHILADIHQAIGRLRAHRRPGQKLRVYFLGDYPLDLPVTLKKASDITLEAATKDERVKIAIRKAVQQLNKGGQKITQSAIAQLSGYSQQHISRFRDLLKTLLSNSNREMSKTSGESLEPEEVQEARWLGSEYLPLAVNDYPPEQHPSELLKVVLEVYQVGGSAYWQAVWSATPAATQIKILQSLLLALPAAEMRLPFGHWQSQSLFAVLNS